MPTAMERVIWGTGDGGPLPVIDTPLGKVGSVICWENYMPCCGRQCTPKGSNCTVRSPWTTGRRGAPDGGTIALEGRCFVLSACQVLRRADLPPGYPTGRFSWPTKSG